MKFLDFGIVTKMGVVEEVGGFLKLSSPLLQEKLPPLGKNCDRVQISSPLADHEYKILAAFLEDYPEVWFRVYGGYEQQFRDLRFLKYFPTLRCFWIDLFEFQALEELAFLSPELTHLHIGETRSKRFSLKLLRRFQALKSLSISQHKKDLEVVATLHELRRLSLAGITLPGLQIFEPLERLTSFSLVGGSTRDLSALPGVGRLKDLCIGQIRGLDSLDALSELTALEFFRVYWQRQITHLPDLSALTHLKSVELDTLRGLTDLSGLARAPGLEDLLFVTSGLSPDIMRPFAGHPTLKRARVHLGSMRKNDKVKQILGL